MDKPFALIRIQNKYQNIYTDGEQKTQMFEMMHNDQLDLVDYIAALETEIARLRDALEEIDRMEFPPGQRLSMIEQLVSNALGRDNNTPGA